MTLSSAKLASALADVGLATFDALLAAYADGPDEMRRFVGNTPLLTDARPRIEYFGSLPENEPGPDAVSPTFALTRDGGEPASCYHLRNIPTSRSGRHG